MKTLYESILDAGIDIDMEDKAIKGFAKYEDVMNILKQVGDIFKELNYYAKIQDWGRQENRYGQPSGNAFGISGARVYSFITKHKTSRFEYIRDLFKKAYKDYKNTSVTENTALYLIVFKDLKMSVSAKHERTIGDVIRLTCRQDDEQLNPILRSFAMEWEEPF